MFLNKMVVILYVKKLPILPIEGDEHQVHQELLFHAYEESCIVPVSCYIEEDDGRDYLTQKYVDQMEHLMLQVKGEIISPEISLFDSKVFTLNYKKFYN